MTTYAAEPGTRLGGRYRLEDRIAAGAGWAAWKAIDETLARAVTVFTFSEGFPRIVDVVTAARAASRLTDPRLAQVFDVEDALDRAYVVMEWAAGETLGDLLSHGPLEPARAGRMIAEAAAALSVAHTAGVAHMCLAPGSLRWSPTGEVKVVGLGLDAALSGTAADDPVLADTVGLGRLLYAALTGYWPGSHDPTLPPAPVADGQPCSPRQVVAGIPAALSAIACGAIGLRNRDGNPPLTTPNQLARALLAAVPPAPPPAAAGPAGRFGAWPDQARHPAADGPPPRRADQRQGGRSRRRRGDWRDSPDLVDAGGPTEQGWPGFVPFDAGEGRVEAVDPMAGSRWQAAPPGPEDWLDEFGADSGQFADLPERPGRGLRDGYGGRRRRSRSRAPVVALAAVGVVALAAIAAFRYWPHAGGGAPSGHPSGSPSRSSASATVLQPVAASGFDPLTSVKADRGNENTQYARYAIDGDPGSAWQSQWYTTPLFGGLKTGSGLLIDLGRPVRLTSVTVTFGSLPGANVELLLGSSTARSRANLASMTTVASQNNAADQVPFTITSQATGRYLVIWFTRLPPFSAHSKHKFMASVYNVTVKGIP
jgi:eukaryotic-like serine/threonine-protein kinase